MFGGAGIIAQRTYGVSASGLKAWALSCARKRPRVLGTKSLSEAKARQGTMHVEAETRWQQYRELLQYGPRELTDGEVMAVVTRIAVGALEAPRMAQDLPATWKTSVNDDKWKRVLGATERLAGAVMAEVDRELAALGLVVTAKDRRRIGDKLVGYDPVGAAAAAKAKQAGTETDLKVGYEGELDRIAGALEYRAATGDYSPPGFRSWKANA